MRYSIVLCSARWSTPVWARIKFACFIAMQRQHFMRREMTYPMCEARELQRAAPTFPILPSRASGGLLGCLFLDLFNVRKTIDASRAVPRMAPTEIPASASVENWDPPLGDLSLGLTILGSIFTLQSHRALKMLALSYVPRKPQSRASGLLVKSSTLTPVSAVSQRREATIRLNVTHGML